MREVAIVGAGELGGLVAHALVRWRAADLVRLIDENGRVAEGKASTSIRPLQLKDFPAVLAGSTDRSSSRRRQHRRDRGSRGRPRRSWKPGSERMAGRRSARAHQTTERDRPARALSLLGCFPARARRAECARASHRARRGSSDPRARRSSLQRQHSSRSSSTCRLAT